MATKTVMVQGTTSDAGKSALVTGLCRYFFRRDEKVVPFKPQNMALNSAVTEDGGEIGRAQAVQANACSLAAHTDMNPVLLKPNSDQTSQIIIHGQAVENLNAAQYHQFKSQAFKAVMNSYRRLQTQYQHIIVEGAGSPAEINLRSGDIANMGFAEAVDCPVVLIADIDRGGVFAHIVGTLALLSETEKKRIIGFVINRFRGDMALLQPGIDWLQAKTGKPVFGVLPYLPDFYLDAEDSVGLEQNAREQGLFHIVVPRLPRISNHTDLDPLSLHPDISLQLQKSQAEYRGSDLIILPGSKSVRDDLCWLKQQGWDAIIRKHLRYGGKLLGICGGFQMLGDAIHDPHGIEGIPGSSKGLDLLEMQTTLQPKKKLSKFSGNLVLNNVPVSGYEIHSGKSTGRALSAPLIKHGNNTDGVLAADGLVAGSYVHGLFDLPEACNTLLQWAGFTGQQTAVDMDSIREQGIDVIADAITQHLDMALWENTVLEFYQNRK